MQRLLIAIIVGLLLLIGALALAPDSFNMDGDQIAQLVKYGMIAALIGSGVLASQRNLGQAVRSLAIWSLIALALVTVYLYRNDAQDVASRLTAGLIPGRASTFTDAQGFNTVVLYKASNGHFQADVSINGRNVPMMVDTGASMIALTYEDAERAGLDMAGLSFTSPVMTANGRAMMAPVTIPSLSIGGIERTNIRAGVAERGRMDESLLGMSFLQTLSAFSFEGDELKLRD
jgi:aspartyl protease family protein